VDHLAAGSIVAVDLGNTAPRAIQESSGIMVNYLYDHHSIEDNHEFFVRDGTIVRSPDVTHCSKLEHAGRSNQGDRRR
jgi:hypothetical protein